MNARTTLTTALLFAALVTAGCGTDNDAPTAGSGDQLATPTPTPDARDTSAASPPDDTDTGAEDDAVRGTVVRFTARGASVDVTLRSDHPTSRDFLSRLPMTVDLEEFAGREKIAYLEPRLDTDGAPGSDPEDGDLIYFKPWGNLGFYYDTSGIGYSDDTINLGTYQASQQDLEALQGTDVRVTIVR